VREKIELLACWKLAGDLVKTLLVRFRVGGDLRFLSHQEMMRVWARALARSGVSLHFSSGFNPHPKISLPLPRHVGVISEEDLACVQMEVAEGGALDGEDLKGALGAQMPEDLRIASIEVIDGKISPQPQGAKYEVRVLDGEHAQVGINNLNAKIATGEPLLVKRLVDVKKGITQTRDISEYIDSIALDGCELSWKTKIKPTGTVRVEEMLELLGLKQEQLGSPVVRKEIEWKF